MLIEFCRVLYYKHKESFDTVTEIGGTKRAYFSKSPEGMYKPEPIEDSGIYVDVHFDARTIRSTCLELILKFGNKEDALSIINAEKDPEKGEGQHFSFKREVWHRARANPSYSRISQCVSCEKLNKPSCPGAVMLKSKQYCSAFAKKK